MSIKIAKTGFFFLFIFTPLAFGTTEPWAYAVMEGVTVFSVLFFFIHIYRHHESIYRVPGFLPLFLFLLYILFQMIPLPQGLVELLSPQAFDIHKTRQFLCDSNGWMPLTINFQATLADFFKYTTYVLFYILTVQLLRTKSTLQATAITIVFFGGLLAFSSILQFYLTDDMALWFRHVPDNSIVVGPYVNHNHYAGLMEMIFPVVLGLFLFYRPRIGKTSLLKGIVEMFSQEKANIHILIGAAALLIATSIFVSLSRGAMISTFLSLIVFCFLLLKRKISRGNTLLIIGVIMATALVIGWFGWDQIFERFARLKKAQGVIYESRLDFWKDTTAIIQNYPITGSGTGTFEHIYPVHRSLVSERFLTHAHNDYLELLAETGIIGFTLAACFLFSLLYQTYKVFKKRKDAFSIYLYMGAITGIISILIHSLTDFNLHIGANGLWFFFLSGLAVSAANTGIRSASQKTRLTPVRFKGYTIAACITSIVLVLLIVGFNISSLIGAFYYASIKNYSMSTQTPPAVIDKIEQIADYAIRFDPLQAEYVFTKANTAWFRNETKKADLYFKSAIRLDPLNARHLSRYGTFLAQSQNPQKTRTALKRAMQYERSNPEYAFQYGVWLLSNHQPDKALKIMKKTLTLDEKYIDQVLTAMIVSGIESEQIEQAIPETPGPSIAFSKFLFDTGNTMEAVDRYLDTLDMIESLKPDPRKDYRHHEHKISSYYFIIYRFFLHHRDYKNAMQVMERAQKFLPMDAGIKVALGDLYYQLGITYKAIENYDHALILQPDNKRALEMLKKISP